MILAAGMASLLTHQSPADLLTMLRDRLRGSSRMRLVGRSDWA